MKVRAISKQFDAAHLDVQYILDYCFFARRFRLSHGRGSRQRQLSGCDSGEFRSLTQRSLSISHPAYFDEMNESDSSDSRGDDELPVTYHKSADDDVEDPADGQPHVRHRSPTGSDKAGDSGPPICGARCEDGTKCQRTICGPLDRCWQHAEYED